MWVDSQSLLYVRSHPAGAFCSQKINIPGILGHARFAESVLLVIFWPAARISRGGREAVVTISGPIPASRGGQEEGKVTTLRYHTPVDPKGSADIDAILLLLMC